MYFVYCLKNKVNGKVYIGKSNRLSRIKDHFKIANGGKEKYKNVYSLIHSAIEKYGETNFDSFILEELDNPILCLEREKYWITFYKSDVNRFGNDFGYNLTAGGDGVFGRKVSETTKEKLRIANLGKVLSQEHKDKIKKEHLQNPRTNGMTGVFDKGCKIIWPTNDDLVFSVKKVWIQRHCQTVGSDRRGS